MPQMTKTFKFSIGDPVTHQNGMPGTIGSAAVSREGSLGYFVDYLTYGGEAKEVYALEAQLSARVAAVKLGKRRAATSRASK